MATSQETRRLALITGGARRVGRGVALHLANQGWDVAITYHTGRDAAASLVAEVEGVGRRCLAIEADFAAPPAAVDAVRQPLANQFDRLDVLLHNASLYQPSDVMSADLSLLRRFWAVHVETPLLLTRDLAPLLRAAGGTVLAMTDVHAQHPYPAYATYCASKAALANLVPSWARVLAPDVTANAIAPGVVEWPDDLPQEQRQAYLKRVPLGRAGSPEDVARLVHFLATGGKYITGQTIRLDGGRSIR